MKFFYHLPCVKIKYVKINIVEGWSNSWTWNCGWKIKGIIWKLWHQILQNGYTSQLVILIF